MWLLFCAGSRSAASERFPGFLTDPQLQLLRFLPLLLQGCIGDCLETGRYHFITVLLKRIEHGALQSSCDKDGTIKKCVMHLAPESGRADEDP